MAHRVRPHLHGASRAAGRRTLEIGAGTGTHLPFEPAGEYVALEASKELADQIPRREGLTVVVADCEERLPWEDDSFDRVLAIHLLEHLYNLPAALDEVARVLRPEGVFSVVIPCEGGAALLGGSSFHDQADLREALPHALRVDDPAGPLQFRDARCSTSWPGRFRVGRRVYFPSRLPSVDLNLMVGLDLAPRP